MQYRTKQGDVVDLICYRHYGREDYAMQVYARNRGLVDYGPILPAGVLITLPKIAAPQTPLLPKISLFD